MSASLIPTPVMQFFDSNGDPLSGGKVYTYAAGTSTPLATYTDQGGATPNANPVILDSRGEAAIWFGVSSTSSYKIVLRTSADVLIWTADNVTDSLASLAGSGGSSLVGFLQSGTGAVARTAQNKMRDVVNVRDFAAAVGNTAAANTTAVQAALTSLTTGGRLEFTVPGTYALNPLTVSVANTTIYIGPGVALSFATLGVNTRAITGAANGLSVIGQGKIQGPATGVYVAGEAAIYMVGTSTSARNVGLKVEGIEITAFGAYGIYAKFVDFVDVNENYLHDIGESGATFLSCNRGIFHRNRIEDITPGTGGNMYGVSFTHDSTGYVGGDKQATNPFCWSWSVMANEISDINWEAIDCHGAYEIKVIGNQIYATQKGIAVTTSSGAAINYAGWSNIISNNVVDARNRDGTTSGYENDDYGINVNGGSSSPQVRVVVTGNIVIYKGIINNTSSGAIQAVLCQRTVISDNVVDFWHGAAVNITSGGGIISNNFFGAVAAGGDVTGTLVRDAGPTTLPLSLVGNQHFAGGLNAASFGFVQQAGATVRPLLTGNNFKAANTPFSLSTGGYCVGTDVDPVLNTAASSGAIDIAELAGSDASIVFTSNGTGTVTNFTNGAAGQRIVCTNTGSGTITVDRTNAFLAGGTNKDLLVNQTLELKKYGSTWKQISYANNS